MSTYVHICLYMFISVYMFIYVHICSYLSIYVHICSYMFIYVHICSYMLMYIITIIIYIHIYTYMYILYTYLLKRIEHTGFGIPVLSYPQSDEAGQLLSCALRWTTAARSTEMTTSFPEMKSRALGLCRRDHNDHVSRPST